MRPSGTEADAGAALEERQRQLAAAAAEAWTARGGAVAAVFAAGPPKLVGEGAAGDPAWAAAAVMEGGDVVETAVTTGVFGSPYRPGYLWLRQGAVLVAAVRKLRSPVEVLLVDGTGRDHPRRAGLALQLGAELELPTIGVTDRPLLATGAQPGAEIGSRAELLLDGEVVGYRVRTGRGVRPLCVHAAWRTTPVDAAALVGALCWSGRTPEPLREARRLARTARSRSGAEA